MPAKGAVLAEVSVLRDGRRILDRLSLSITEQRVGIVGRNGSGKTTLARLLAGLIAPDEGRLRLDGYDPAADRRRALRLVGILFQNPDHQIIFPTVVEELAFGLVQQGQTKSGAEAGAARVLAAFGRSHWSSRAVHELSQGQRHLVCLMAVIAMAPPLLILDEPFAGLDIPTARALQRLLAARPERVIHITHDPAALAGYDRVIWLEQGRIAGDGPADAVLAEFVAEMERLGGSDDRTDLAG